MALMVMDRRDIRLRGVWLVAIAAPLATIVALQALRPLLVGHVWPISGGLIVSLLTHAAVLALVLVLFYVVGRAFALVQRQNRELGAVNDVLLAISSDGDLAGTTDRIVRHAQRLLTAHEAGSFVTMSGAEGVSGPIEGDPPPTTDSAYVIQSVTAFPDPSQPGRRHHLWVSRDRRFDEADQHTLDTLGRLARLADEHARIAASRRESAVLTERVRISREMHDSLAQVLSVAHLRLWAIGARPELADSPVRAELHDLAGICHEAHTDVRESIFGLRETARTDRSLVEGLDRCLESFERHAQVDTRLVVEGRGPDLPIHRRMQLLRLVQEALTNIRKHADAQHATVRISCHEDETLLVVEDDGCGFETSAVTQDRFGLETMRERAEAVSGQLHVDSTPGRGTRVTVRVPTHDRVDVAESVG